MFRIFDTQTGVSRMCEGLLPALRSDREVTLCQVTICLLG
jgi:hypothetical protein